MYRFEERTVAARVEWYQPTELELRNQRAAFIRNARAKVQSKPTFAARLINFLSEVFE